MKRMENLFDLVENEAERRSIPRMTLWSRALSAVVDGKLEVQYPHPSQSLGSTLWTDWMVGVHNAVMRDNDPNVCARYLRLISVSSDNFRTWIEGEFNRNS